MKRIEDNKTYSEEEKIEKALYVLPDDPEEEDTTAENEDDFTGEPNGSELTKRKLSPISIMFKTLFTPVEGWKALKRSRCSDEEFASRCFYPLIGFAGACEGSALFYEANFTFFDWITGGLTTFLTFFFSYFSAILLSSVVLPRAGRGVLKNSTGKKFMLLALSTLALFWAIIRLVPMLDPVLVFLPLWTIYIIYKGYKILRLPEGYRTSVTGILCTMAIGLPLFWNWFLELVF